MQYLKMLGLAAIAAMGLMAFVGAGTASATTLCEDEAGTVCYSAGTKTDWSSKKGTSVTLTDTSGNKIATCTNLTIKGASKATSGTPLAIANESIEWEGCSQTTDTIANGEVNVEWTEGTKATVSGAGSQVTVAIFGVSCTYGTGTGTHLGTLAGGEEPEVNISTTVTKVAGGFLCPATTVWDAQLVVTQPKKVWPKK